MKCTGLSASSYQTSSWCEFKYYLEQHLGIRGAAGFPAELGTLCHDLFEQIAQSTKDGKSSDVVVNWMRLLLQAFREERVITNKFGAKETIPPLWTLSKKILEREKMCESCPYFVENKCWVTGKDISTFEGCPKWEFGDAAWLIERIIDTPEYNPENQRIIDVERWFNLPIEYGGSTVNIRGFIDLVTENNKKIIEICDYKTGAIKYYKECGKDMQLRMYHLAARQLYPDYEHIFVKMHYLKYKRPFVFAFGPEDEEETRRQLINRYEEIVANEFPTRRCDRNNGFVSFDFVCKYMCDMETCQEKFEQMIKKGEIEPPKT